jgi:hypothetical protein
MLCWTLMLIWVSHGSLPYPARAGERGVADEVISIDVQNRPLAEVLGQIAAETGCRFEYDHGWDSFPVTASFQEEPLHRGLKRILSRLNTAIVYHPDRRIKINIYPSGAAGNTPSSPSSVFYPEPSSPEPEAPDVEPETPEELDSGDAPGPDRPGPEITENGRGGEGGPETPADSADAEIDASSETGGREGSGEAPGDEVEAGETPKPEATD